MSIRRPRAAWFAVLVAAIGFLLAGCSEGGSIRIFAASSLQDVLPEILDAYAEANDGVTFEVQYGGSQALATQLELGAEADLFLSANELQLERLLAEDLIASSSPFVTNQLVLVVGADSEIEQLEDVADPGVRLALGAPEVPVGELTQRALQALDPALAASIRDNVVTEDPNVRVVLSRVVLGEADAAFVYRTDAATSDDVRAIELPIDLEPNVYLGGVLVDADAQTGEVLEFLTASEAEPIWRSAGFEPVVAP